MARNGALRFAAWVLPSDEDLARRLRAMWAYSGDDQGAFVAAVGEGATTNMLRRKGAAPPSIDALVAAADHVGWSTEFAFRGPAAIESPGESLAERVQTLENSLTGLTESAAHQTTELARVGRVLEALLSQGRLQPPEEGGRR